jgi:hypothetical protein
LRINAGELLEIGEHIEGDYPDLDAPENAHPRDQLAGQFAIGALLGDWGGFHWVNLLRTDDGRLYHIDFDEGLHSRMREVGPFEWLPHRHPEIFGRLRAEDVLAQFAHLLAQRERLLAVLPNQELSGLVTERLDWVAEVVAAGGLRQRPAASACSTAPADPRCSAEHSRAVRRSDRGLSSGH